MLEIRDKDASTSEVRKQDISSWQEASITKLNSKAKKRFSKNKSAITAYFTGDKPIEEIATRYNLSTEQLLKMAKNCLKQHEDGTLWGYRALLPGLLVKDFSASAAPAQDPVIENAPSIQETQQEQSSADNEGLEDTAKRLAIKSIEDVPVQSIDSTETGRIENQQAEAAPIPIPTTETPEAASDEVNSETPGSEVADQTDDTEATIQNTDREFLIRDADSPTGEADNSMTEIAAVDEDDVPVAETAVSVDATEDSAREIDSATHETPVDNVEGSLLENRSIQDEPSLLQMPTVNVDEVDSLEQENQEAPVGEDILAEPPVVEASEVENNAEIEIQDPASSSDEQQGSISQDEPLLENQVSAVTVISNDLIQLLPNARITVPLIAEEDADVSWPIDPYILPKYVKHDTYTTNAHIAQHRRFVRKRWERDAQDKTKRNRIYRTISIAMISVILLSLLLPIGVGLAAYNVYNNVSGIAHDGINRLMTVKSLLPTSKSDIMSVLNASKLEQAQNQLKLAEADFIQLQQLAARPDIESLIEQVAPQYAGKLAMAKHLLQVALDVTRMGQELGGVGVIAAHIVHSSPLATGSAKPLISTSDVTDIKAAITHALYYMDDIQQNMSQVQMKDLPVSAKQQAQLSAVLTELPTIRNLIVQNQNMVDLVTWLLGIGQPRRFLVQTMDTGELRPGGGFTGQYGILSIQNGRMGSFTLRDVALLDYAGNGSELGRQAPPQYSNWMNFGNWGLRDSNLSGDYPTTAQINRQVFQEEGGSPIDGVIDFTPTFIGHIIDVTGPIHVKEYNETITASNLEDRLHYYQQDQNAITIENAKSHDYSHQARKAFTSLLGSILLQRVRSMPTNKLITIVKNAVKDIQSRDLEIYFTNPAAEQWLVNNGYSGGMSTFSKQDGFMLVQANISISKASQFVHTTEQDAITLDAQGGATHNMTVTLDYNQTGPVYGYDTYSDYMRLYVPHSSQFISGDGFDTGHSLCTPSTVVSNQSNHPTTTTTTPVIPSCDTLPPSETLYCPSGDYSLGVRSYNVAKTADVMGAPTVTTSDLSGRGMFGGMTVTPKNCTSTIMLSWYVPHAVKHIGKQLVYPLLVQKQGGLIPTLELSVDASAVKGMKSFNFKGDMHADRVFNIR